MHCALLARLTLSSPGFLLFEISQGTSFSLSKRFVRLSQPPAGAQRHLCRQCRRYSSDDNNDSVACSEERCGFIFHASFWHSQRIICAAAGTPEV